MPRPAVIKPDDFPWFDYSRYTFSLGLEVGPSAYLSGHSASEYDSGDRRIVVRGGMAEQARTAYAKVERILETAGFTLADVVRIVENVTLEGIEHYAEADLVRAEVFGSNAPAVNTVVVQRLLRPSAWIEVEVTASKSPRETYGVTSAGRAAYAPAVATGGVVYLSTVFPLDAAGEVVGRDDVAAQVRQIFENAQGTLAQCGLDLGNVVKTNETIRPAALADYRTTGGIRKEFLGPVYPAAAGIVQEQVSIDEDVLISYDFVASAHDGVAVNPGWDRYAKLSYSPAVRAGDILFMSGQAALDPVTERAVNAGDIGAQAEYTYGNIIEVLDATGFGPKNLIKTIEYVTPSGLGRYRDVAAVREKLLREPWPASTGALCHSLLRPEFEIEIDPMAIDIGEGV